MAFDQTFATASRPVAAGKAAAGRHLRNDHKIAGAEGHAAPTHGRRWVDVAAAAGVFLAYTLTLYVAHGQHPGMAILGGVANTIPVVVFGGAVRWLIMRTLVGRSAWRQVVGHVCFGAIFSLLALWLLLVLLGMFSDLSPVHFNVAPFTAEGNAFQLLENVTTYVAIAMLSYIQMWRRTPLTVPDEPPQSVRPSRAVAPHPGKASRHFIRRGEDILPIDLDAIVCITGADDYAEVSTLERTYLVKMTLNEFGQTLDPTRFVRVHRSTIVNLECVKRAESAGGGRMLVHMSNGRAIQASRAGTQLLRDRIL